MTEGEPYPPDAAVGPPKPTPEGLLPRVHDPCIIREGEFYYVFSTGRGIPIYRSRDLIRWEAAGRVFAEDVPPWAKRQIPGATGLWAPDIALVDGRFRLHYSVSTFGSNRSIIGAATTRTLDPASAEFAWTDDGKVIESFPHDDHNAIDANLVFAGPGELALAFGSFWSGIKLVSLDARTGKPLPGAPIVPLARRPKPCAVEAPFIVRRGASFYLFVSFDLCCRGLSSTYNLRVGRASRAEGPYEDESAKPLLEGGGTLLLGTHGRVVGPGHCAVLQEAGGDWWLVHHFYNGDNDGAATLQVRPLSWTEDGWPRAGEPLPRSKQEPL